MRTLFLLMALAFTSCDSLVYKQKSESPAEQALKEGFVFVGGSERIVHWDKSCKRAQKVMLLKSAGDLPEDIELCVCVPVRMAEKLKTEILMAYYFTDKNKEKVSYRNDSGVEGTISVSNIMKYGLKSYIDEYPDYTIRMKDKFNSDYAVPFRDIFRSLDIGCKIYTFNIDE